MSFSAFLGPCDYTNFWTMKNTVGRSYSSASTQFRATKRLHATFDQVDDSFLCQIARVLPLLVHLRFSLFSFFILPGINDTYQHFQEAGFSRGFIFRFRYLWQAATLPTSFWYTWFGYFIAQKVVRGYINIVMSATFDC